MNNKGFMMAEVIVVAAIVLMAMVGLYASYNKIFSLYNKRVDYYDVATLYELGNIRSEIDFTSKTTSINSTIYTNDDSDKIKVYYIKSNGKSDDNTSEEEVDIKNLSKSNKINSTFKDYLEFLSDSIKVGEDNILVMERCITTDNCKYAYLEVFNEE